MPVKSRPGTSQQASLRFSGANDQSRPNRANLSGLGDAMGMLGEQIILRDWRHIAQEMFRPALLGQIALDDEEAVKLTTTYAIALDNYYDRSRWTKVRDAVQPTSKEAQALQMASAKLDQKLKEEGIESIGVELVDYQPVLMVRLRDGVDGVVRHFLPDTFMTMPVHYWFAQSSG